MIVLDTYAGLANRMRTIVSGVSMAKAFEQNLTVIWPINSDLNCSYCDLFLPNRDFEIKSESFTSWLLRRHYSRYYFIRKLSDLYSGIFSYNYNLYDSDFNEKVWVPPLYSLTKEKIHDFNNAYIKTCNEFFLPSVKYSEVFIPHDSISMLINKNVSLIDSYTIGVHIRQNDHTESIRKTPLAKFIGAMNNEVDIQSKTNFYLASDSVSVKNEVIKIFGKDRIFVQDGEIGRGSKTGMIHSMVDLYSLSHCCKIYGSYGSSFSEVASNLNKKELIIPK